MLIKRTVGHKGQVVIPKDLRDHLGIKEGSKILFEAKGDTVTIKAEQSPGERVKEYISIVKEKLKGEVDIEGILEEGALEEVDLRR